MVLHLVVCSSSVCIIVSGKILVSSAVIITILSQVLEKIANENFANTKLFLTTVCGDSCMFAICCCNLATANLVASESLSFSCTVYLFCVLLFEIIVP